MDQKGSDLEELKFDTTSLDFLFKRDIRELKSLRSPPALIAQILDAVQYLLKRPVGFANAKKSIGQWNFLDDLYQTKGRIDSGEDYSVVYRTVKKITI